MTVQKKVSVFITTYNFGDYISQTLDSVLNQEFDSYEICISDDGSTDDTQKILKEYADKYPDIIKINFLDKNYGIISTSINAGHALSLCEGEYVAWLDGDDIMLPGRLKDQFEFLEANQDYVGVSHWCDAFDSQTGISLGNLHAHLDVWDRDTLTLIKKGNSVPPTLMFRNTGSVRFDCSLKKMPDWLFYIELSRLGKIGHQDKVLTKYRRHGRNQTSGVLNEDIFITLSILEYRFPEYLNSVMYHRTDLYLSKAGEMARKTAYRTALFLGFTALRIRPGLTIYKIITKIIGK